jgi:hypothetical protein
MQFDLLKPCSNCPFLRKGGCRLMEYRVREIAGAMLDTQGTVFACHKTTPEDDDGEPQIIHSSRHCAGALIFAEKNKTATQMMRIMERMGYYDARKLMKDKRTVARVFSTLKEMLAVNKKGL